MTQSAKRFAGLLQEGINTIAERTAKPKGIIRDELGYAIGRKGGSAIEYWAYGDGRIPKQQQEVAALARTLVNVGKLDQEWLTAFLGSAGYPNGKNLVAELFPTSADASSHNLPLATTPFVGRQQELADLADLLANPDCRLITLVGPGGSGKTRLAIEVARNAAASFANGSTFAALASLESATLSISTVATALNFTLDQNTESLTQVVRYLRGQTILLVLDNFEHLLPPASPSALDGETNPAVALIQGILAEAADVTLLVTSRERLNLQGEWVYDVGGLEIPAAEISFTGQGGRPTADIEHYSALALFIQAAQRAQASFTPTGDDLTAIVHICRLVDGMPLALELAATWVRVVSCQEVAAEIKTSLDFLSTTLHDLPPRHRSMQAVFDHSWQLLTPEEQQIVAHCSVFRGGFTREAAAQVTDATLPILAALVNKSWLSHNGQGRYTIHELARQYGAERLTALQQTTQTRNRHLAFFMALSEAAEPRIRSGPQSAAWHDRVELEHDNIRAALDWSFTAGEFEPGLRMVAALWEFWMNRSYVREGQTQAERFLRRPEAAAHTYVRVKALHTAGVCAFFRGHYTTALVWLREGETASRDLGPTGRYPLALVLTGQGYTLANLQEPETVRALGKEILTLGHELNDDWVRGHALNLLGLIDRSHGDHNGAWQRFLESFRCFQTDGDGVMRGSVLMQLGRTLFEQGDYVAAQTYLTRSLAVYEELTDKLRSSNILRFLGYLALALGKPTEAEELLSRALTLVRQTGHTQNLIRTLYARGRVAQWQGDYEYALTLHRESLTLSVEVDRQAQLPLSIEAFACLAATQGEAQRAATLFGAMDACAATTEAHEELRYILNDPNLRAEHEHLLAHVKRDLGEAAFAAAWANGAAMTLEEAIDFALEDGITTVI